MLRRQNHLNRRIISNIHRMSRRQRHLRQTDRPRVRQVTGSLKGKRLDHGVAHVSWDGAEAHVHVDEARGMAGKPAWLEGDGAAADGPFCAVGRGGHAAACQGLEEEDM